MKKIIERIKSIDKGTMIRTLSLILAISNQIIAVLGATSYADALWYQIASLVVTIVTAIVAAWNNNDFTSAAKLGTKVLDALQDGKITPEEVQELLDKNEEKSGDKEQQ